MRNLLSLLSRWTPFALVVALAFLMTGTFDGCTRKYDGPKNTVDITDATFASEVTEAPGLVAVDFWATWCGPCRRIEPILEELAGEYKGRVKIAKLDVDQHPDTAEEYQVQSLPTIWLFKDGKAVDMKLGALSKKDYAAWFEEHL